MQSSQCYNSLFYHNDSKKIAIQYKAKMLVDDVINTAITNVIMSKSKDSQRTSSETNSDHVFEIDMPNFVYDARISDRLVRGSEIRLITYLPAVDRKFDPITFITPQGVFQLNQEVQEFKCILNAESFAAKFGYRLLDDARYIDEAEGRIVHNEFTLKELLLLEYEVRLNRGTTVIGYTINEEVYLRSINFIASKFSSYPAEYPPLPNAYSKLMLNFAQKPIVLDISSVFRGAGQTLLLLAFFIRSYEQYKRVSEEESVQFLWAQSNLLLMIIGALIVGNFIVLRGNCIQKKPATELINRLRFIERGMLGFSENWTNYASLILPSQVIQYGFIPLLVLGGIRGYLRKESAVVNVRKYATFKILKNSISLSLTTGSFVSLGLSSFVMHIGFPNIQNTSELNEYYYTLAMLRYLVCSIMFIFSIGRYPYNSLSYKANSEYISSIINGISNTLLDNYSLFSWIQLMFIACSDSATIPNNMLALYYGLEIFIFLYTAFVIFPTINNLAFLSTNNLPKQESKLGKLVNWCLQKDFLAHANYLPCTTQRQLMKSEGIDTQLIKNTNQDKLTSVVSPLYCNNI